MKRFIMMTATAAFLGAAASCGQSNEPPAEGSKIGFALSFFRNVNAVTPSQENIVVSPYSAGVALSMLETGAEGETKVEIDKALNGTLFKAEDMGGGDNVTVQSSNSVWISRMPPKGMIARFNGSSVCKPTICSKSRLI